MHPGGADILRALHPAATSCPSWDERQRTFVPIVMRYGVIPTSLVERLAISAGYVPIPVMDLLHSIIKSRVIMAGVRLGIFEALGPGPRDAASLAAELRLDAGSLELLLRTLVIADYLTVSRGKFRLTTLARESMLAGGRRSLVGFANWNYAHWEFVSQLEELVRTGRGVNFHETLRDPEAWGHYQRAMLEAARFFASTVARHVPVRRGARRLLDVGGSHGLVGAAIARRHQPMRSTVLDLPQAVEYARALAAGEGLGELVEHRGGNILTDDIGSGWDVVLCSSILHHFEAPQIRRVLTRVYEATARDGTVAIWDIERPAPDAPPTPGDGAALFFRLTSTAGTYHGSDYSSWLAEAGFTRVTIKRPRLSPGHVLVCGRR